MIYTGELPELDCQVIYADPAWMYRDRCNDGNRGAVHKYPVIELSDLMQLPVRRVAAENCVLFMWWVPPMPMEALKVIEAWGFRLSNMKAFTWVKLNKRFASVVRKHFSVDQQRLDAMEDGEVLELMTRLTKLGMGHWTRANSEDCLVAVRGKPKRIDAGIKQIVFGPNGEHSAKPDEVRRRIVQLCGDVPRIELFARNCAPGWHAWGNELEPPEQSAAVL